jgi:radical SAM superfamily enzyme YgiQ (UPF0313 family)
MSGTFDPAKQGRGAYLKVKIPKPAGLEDIPRNFSRYGIKPEWFRQDLSRVPRPDLVLVTSLMTYWYPGVRETIKYIRDLYPQTGIILGGIYAALCRDHAVLNCDADHVVSGPGEATILGLVEEFTGYSASARYDPDTLDTLPYPAYDLHDPIPYVPLMTSRGCPFACAYCASHYIHPKRLQRSPDSVVEEIDFWHNKFGVIDFAFYDDALLVNAEEHIIPILKGIIRKKLRIRFHTPNAVHVSEIKNEVAQLMFKAGFETIRLGVESIGFQSRKNLDRKMTVADFNEGVALLKNAGFRKDQIGAYLLVGLPDQQLSEIKNSIKAVKTCGITPVMAYYSPIPQTALWKRAVASSRYDLESDPVFSNNAIMPCQKESYSWETISGLKKLIST